MVDAPSHGGWALSTQEVTIKKIMLLLAALITGLATLVFPNTASNAEDNNVNGIPDAYETTGWWNTAYNGRANADGHTYPDYPVTCYSGTTQRAFQVIFAYPEGWEPATQTADFDVSRQKTFFARANSILPASAKYVTPNVASLQSNYSPRWVTTGAGVNCTPQITEVAIPSQHQVPDGSGSDSVLTDYLESQGFNDPLRNYVVLYQHTNAMTPGWEGIADLEYDDSKSLANLNNQGGRFLTVKATKSEWQDWARVRSFIMRNMSHEMAHALGGVQDSAPNAQPASNTKGRFHVTDCWDILCYAPPTTGQTYDNNCGQQTDYQNVEPYTSTMKVRAVLRWDCNRDDYFNADSPTSGYLSNHWNIADSSFLWGNPQP